MRAIGFCPVRVKIVFSKFSKKLELYESGNPILIFFKNIKITMNSLGIINLHIDMFIFLSIINGLKWYALRGLILLLLRIARVAKSSIYYCEFYLYIIYEGVSLELSSTLITKLLFIAPKCVREIIDNIQRLTVFWELLCHD